MSAKDIALLIAVFAYFGFGISTSVLLAGILYGGNDSFAVHVGKYIGFGLSLLIAMLATMYLRIVGVIG